MLRQVPLLLLVLAVHQIPAQVPPAYVENLNNEDSNPYIVSGWDAEPGQHPHQVSIRMVGPGGAVTGCGANVISREWLLTSAHCTASQITIVVRAGLIFMTRPEMILETTEYYLYPTFNENTPMVVQINDISLVKLQQPLQYSQNLRPIRVQPSADAHRDYTNEILYASGFGRTWTSGALPERLQWVYLTGVSNQACANTYGTTLVTDNTICARFFNVTSQSICQGDSGGPLVHVSSEGVPTLIGLSSFVPGLPWGCHSGFPGAFARPGPFLSWMYQITEIDFENLNEDDDITTTITTTTPTNATTTTPMPTNTTTTATTPTNATTTTPMPTNTTTTATTPTNATTTTPMPTNTTTTATTPTNATTTTSMPTNTTTTETTPTNATTTTPMPTNTTTTATTPSNATTTTTTPTNTTTTPMTPTTTDFTTTTPSTTTAMTPDGEEDDDDDIDDPELAELLKRLEVKVKVKVSFSKFGKRHGDEEED